MAEESKNAMISLALKHLDKKGEEYDLDKINRTIRELSRRAFEYYMSSI